MFLSLGLPVESIHVCFRAAFRIVFADNFIKIDAFWCLLQVRARFLLLFIRVLRNCCFLFNFTAFGEHDIQKFKNYGKINTLFCQCQHLPVIITIICCYFQKTFKKMWLSVFCIKNKVLLPVLQKWMLFFDIGCRN